MHANPEPEGADSLWSDAAADEPEPAVDGPADAAGAMEADSTSSSEDDAPLWDDSKSGGA